MRNSNIWEVSNVACETLIKPRGEGNGLKWRDIIRGIKRSTNSQLDASEIGN